MTPERTLLISAICLLPLLGACHPGAFASISISDDARLDHRHECIEIPLSRLEELSGKRNGGSPVIRDRKGCEVPYQTYREYEGQEILVFPVDMYSGKKAVYYLAFGTPSEYETVAFSRHVPERRDDYAYENDLVAGRIYGPSLKKPRTLGSDIWTKSVSEPVIDRRYASGTYHKDSGDGMDCYKVGNTLGGGALAPVGREGNIVLGDNWKEAEHITDGAVRTKARFVHGPFSVDGRDVRLVREMTLDRGTHFIAWENVIEADCDSIDVVLAAVLHDSLEFDCGPGWICFEEKASDSKNPDRDGNIFVGLVMDPGIESSGIRFIDGHAALMARVATGERVSVWTASAWNHAGVKTHEQWRSIVSDFARAQKSPLRIKIRKL